MNTKCKICEKELPLTKTRAGIPIPGKKYCDVCGKSHSRVVRRLREDKVKLIKHYDIIKKELKVIEDLKELIQQGEDIDARTKEILETGQAYWEKYNLSKYYKSDSKKSKTVD